ncbi:MAG: hypothetical protein ACE5H1_04365, partial [Thermodesulfobacteriota bacterium]
LYRMALAHLQRNAFAQLLRCSIDLFHSASPIGIRLLIPTGAQNYNTKVKYYRWIKVSTKLH